MRDRQAVKRSGRNHGKRNASSAKTRRTPLKMRPKKRLSKSPGDTMKKPRRPISEECALLFAAFGGFKRISEVSEGFRKISQLFRE